MSRVNLKERLFRLPFQFEISCRKSQNLCRMFDEIIASVVEIVAPENANVSGETGESSLNLTVLKGGFSTCDACYKFEVKSDGAGTIFYLDFHPDSEEFSHEANLETLIKEIEEAVHCEIELQSKSTHLKSYDIENIREEIVAEKLEEFFWEEINQTLEDPFFRSFDDESEWGRSFIASKAARLNWKNFWNYAF